MRIVAKNFFYTNNKYITKIPKTQPHFAKNKNMEEHIKMIPSYFYSARSNPKRISFSNSSYLASLSALLISSSNLSNYILCSLCSDCLAQLIRSTIMSFIETTSWHIKSQIARSMISLPHTLHLVFISSRNALQLH